MFCCALCTHIFLSFGAHERSFLSLELQPLLETLGGVTSSVERGGTAPAMTFTRRMEEVDYSKTSANKYFVMCRCVLPSFGLRFAAVRAREP